MITVALIALFLSQYIIITVVTNIEKYTYALKQSVSVADHLNTAIAVPIHLSNPVKI